MFTKLTTIVPSRIKMGIFIVCICIIGYISAFVFQKKEKQALSLFLIILCGFLLRIYVASDSWLHEWDERYHALVAKHLIYNLLKPTLYNNPIFEYDYKNWTINHIWLHKQPLALWLIAISLKIFGINTWAVRLPSIVFSTIGIKLTYDIAKALYNDSVAFLSAFLFSIHGLIIELTAGRVSTDHIDVTFLFFITLGVWSSIKYLNRNKFFYLLLIGICLGFALLTKWLPALIILPIEIYCICQLKGEPIKVVVIKTLFITLIAICIFLPWQLYILYHYPIEARWEYAYNAKHFYIPIENHEGTFFYYIDNIRMQYGELIYLAIGLFVYGSIKQKMKPDILVNVWFFIPLVFFSIAATKMPSYLIIIAPAIFIMTAKIFINIYNYTGKNTSIKYICRGVAFLLILLPIRYSLERIKPWDSKSSPQWNNDIQLVKNSKYNNNRYVLVNCEHPIELMFATNCIAYEKSGIPLTSSGIIIADYKMVINSLKGQK